MCYTAPMSHPDDLLTASDAARLLEMSRDNVLRLIRRGVLPVAAKTAGARAINLLRRGEVLALAERRREARP